MANGVYHFLDVGGEKYGECTLVEFGDTRILIDGSHVGDFDGQQGYQSIPEQLAEILGGSPPYDITLLVVTHCHADHIGCLPQLVSADIIRPKFALLTDPKLGFGRTPEDDSGILDAYDAANALAAVMREEDVSDLSDEDLASFADAVKTVEGRYAAMIKDLKSKGVEVVPYQGKPLPARIARAVADAQMQLLGPSADQLVFCAEQISTTNKAAKDAVDAVGTDTARDTVAMYRSLVASQADAFNARGNGMNCQSITLAFGPENARVLLAGDMQFAEPGVKGADDEVAALKEAVIAAGPYKLYKTTHHTSHNGQDDEFLDALGSPQLIVHSGGLNDASHPYAALLQVLKRRDISFARTDRNGRITVKPHLARSRAIEISKGRINNFTPNRTGDEPPYPAGGGVVLPAAQPASTPLAAGSQPGPQIVIINLPSGAAVDMTVAGVDIVVRAPSIVRREPSPPPARVWTEPDPSPRPAVLPIRPGPGRVLPALLYVTNIPRLRANIGQTNADVALSMIAAAGGQVISVDGDNAVDDVRKAVSGLSDAQGIVILGGYDVVPSLRTDALGDELRRMLGARVRGDVDQFWVWSDAAYADTDGDTIAELPIARIPDAHDAALFAAALGAGPLSPVDRFGVHNLARPFAIEVWKGVKGQKKINVSDPYLATNVKPADLETECHYFMLHGSDVDGRTFNGEDLSGGYPIAFTQEKVPKKFRGVVFSGCCWGALTVNGKAVDTATPEPRTPERSIALSYLKAGALAFVGCTGSHYSGPSPDLDANFAARLHHAFWKQLAQAGNGPAKALHLAKAEYLTWIVERGDHMDPLDTARRLKNVAQFTCLGLGW